MNLEYHINTTDPEWNEAFSFLIKDPYKEEVQLLVEDRYHGPLGSVSMPICRLLTAETLNITDWFWLGRPEPCGALRVTLELRILVTPLQVASCENQESKVSSSQRPKHKTMNRPRVAPKRLPKAATDGVTTSVTEQPEIWREIMQKVKGILRAIRTVCNK
ncbi:hypothetical protein XELAEV_18023592mg [Xenopus laevis]|uniref:C2 domain-containing protein n=1 Tax=Xenopus laevis TaxID=8355 RepID=A0A974D7B9_XENLA|nr:hypothetical protein XELAEV_18023592mg [Xenopus laevis]